jgi:hypothetical protein
MAEPYSIKERSEGQSMNETYTPPAITAKEVYGENLDTIKQSIQASGYEIIAFRPVKMETDQYVSRIDGKIHSAIPTCLILEPRFIVRRRKLRRWLVEETGEERISEPNEPFLDSDGEAPFQVFVNSTRTCFKHRIVRVTEITDSENKTK